MRQVLIELKAQFQFNWLFGTPVLLSQPLFPLGMPLQLGAAMTSFYVDASSLIRMFVA